MTKTSEAPRASVADVGGWERYYQAVEDRRRRPSNVRHYMEYLFDGVPLSGVRMLDVGAGDGRFSFYASRAGAREVVSLEPGGAGSSQGETARRFQRFAAFVQDPAVRLDGHTLQDYQPDGDPFDVVLSQSSINHLDEQACIRVHRDPAARAEYLRIFEKLAALTVGGGTLIVADVARRNLFGDLHVKNPFAPTIEWQKHQPPRLWAELLGEVGFTQARIRWSTLNSLRHPGQVLLGNRIGAYVTHSSFCLTMRRASG